MENPDFIIVGAGTAGCVLAESLSRDGSRRVLLVEAGGKPSSPFIGIPAGFAKLFKSRFDWAYQSTAGAEGCSVFIPRGRMLGGSSNMNAQIHQWGHPEDFDGWVRAGAEGWGWSEVQDTLRSQEDFAGGSSRRGAAGAMRICTNCHAHPASHAFVAASREAGLGGVEDYNGGDYEGAWIAQVAHRDGHRFSAYDAYLAPALRRENLKVLSTSLVQGVVFEGRRAVGVRVHAGRGETVLRANAGVILAAGAIGSPQILMASGVGPAAQLFNHGVATVHDLPGVGANLQDHPMAVLTFATARRDTLKSAESPVNLLRYLALRKGPLASNAAEALAFARSTPELSAPDIELLFAPLEWRKEALEPPQVHAFSIGAIVASPRSRGSVSLAGPDVRTPPRIDLGLLTDDEGHDARVLLTAILLARRVAAQHPLSAQIVGEIAPGAEVTADEVLLHWARSTIQTVYHPCGTCRMGSDAAAVVTPKLEVRGVDGLWVADASVMPTVPRGHPNAAVAMIAGRAADMIVARAKRPALAPSMAA